MLQIVDAVAADGGTVAGHHAFLRHVHARSRAGYQSAKILPDDVPVRTAVRGTQLAEQLVEVPTAPGYALAVIATEALGWRAAALTIQILVVEVVVYGDVFKVYALDRIQQHGLWSRTFTFQFLQVACMISLFLAVQAHPQYRVMSVGKGIFGLFPEVKKVRSPPRVRVRGCPLGRAHGLRRLVAVITPGSWSCLPMRSSTFGTVTPGRLLGGCRMVGSCAGKCVPMAPMYISSLKWCTSPVTSFDWWSVVSVLGAAQVHCHGLVNLEPIRCEFMALLTVYDLVFGCRCGCPCDHAARVPAIQVVCVLRRVQLPRQIVGHSSCSTEGDSTVQFLNKVVAAVMHDPVLVFRSGGVSDSVIDRVH